jgi:hypothetical protein
VFSAKRTKHNHLNNTQGGEHSVEKISENSFGRLKNLWKHKHSEENPAQFSLKWKQKSLKSENSLRVLQPEYSQIWGPKMSGRIRKGMIYRGTEMGVAH